MTHKKMIPYQDCIRDCNRDFPKCESDCDLNQFLILGRTDFPTYEANGITDEIIEFKNFQYHHHEVDMVRVRNFSVGTIVQKDRTMIIAIRSDFNLNPSSPILVQFYRDRRRLMNHGCADFELKISVFYRISR